MLQGQIGFFAEKNKKKIEKIRKKDSKVSKKSPGASRPQRSRVFETETETVTTLIFEEVHVDTNI